MMVGNDIQHDTRVYKSALALADGGLDVTVLGWSPPGYRQESQFGPVRIIRVPVPWRLRDRANARRNAHRTTRRVPAPPSPRDKRIRALKSGLRRQELAEFGGRGLRARVELDTLGNVAQRKVDAVLARLAPREDAWREAFADWIGEQTAFASWRRDLPEIDDFDLAYGPVIDAEEWEILHAHDVHHVGTAARAVARRRAQGRPAQWVYDAHEYVAGLPIYPPRTKRFVAAYVDLEREYIHRADAVITVTPALADHLREQYALPTTPTVVMNAPQLATEVHLDGPDIRTACGLDADTPLLVYSGGVTPARGVQTVVAALPSLPDVHLALVCVPHHRTRNVRALREQAEQLGVADRLHLLDPVAPAQVSAFLATADVGVHPLVHFGGHEFSLPNKLFEYLHAGLPLAVSDCRALAQFVRDNEVGDVFVAEDPAACATALRDVLARREALHERIVGDPGLLDPYAWERQAASLRGLYRRLLGDDAAVVEPATETALQDVHEEPVRRDDRPSVVGIGPANMAGQAWAWAKALERNIPGLTTRVVVVDRGLALKFPADEIVDIPTYRLDKAWALAFEQAAMRDWTHALLEAGRPLFGLRHGRDFEGDAKVLRGMGVGVGLLMHGSEIRDPSRHAASSPWSPFSDPDDELTARLQAQFDVLSIKVRAFAAAGEGPVFVSTPDLRHDVPGSIWLPVVVDLQRWQPGPPVLEREVPVVVHAPSRAALKGSVPVDVTLSRLHEAGLVEYRRMENVPPEQMPQVMGDADIVLDQFALGTYGVLACEAMAAQRLVISHVVPDTRDLVASVSGRELPIVEAGPDAIEEAIRGLLADRDAARERAAAGRAFVETLHDGRHSAGVLRAALGLRGEQDSAGQG